MIAVASGEPIWAMGLMSGTAMDGVDAAMVRTDGETVAEFGPTAFAAYEREALKALPALMRDPLRYRRTARAEDHATRAAAERETVRLHARAVVDVVPDLDDLPEVIAFPGQTVAHYPEKQWTWQLGDGARLARALNRPVVWDFRSADLRVGGQGAPLAPFFHFALAKRLGAIRPLAFLNIGGVANLTWIDPSAPAPEADGALVAFDTGPGNALINDWMLARTGQAVDADGAMAAAGTPVSGELTTNFVADYQAKPPPKSLDRNAFATLLGRLERLGTADGAATLTAFTADCAAAGATHLPAAPERWLVCGGGRRNPTLMRMLAERVAVPVEPVEAVGLDGDMLEAQAFAYLAVRVLRDLPTSAPGTTGCTVPTVGGRISAP